MLQGCMLWEESLPLPKHSTKKLRLWSLALFIPFCRSPSSGGPSAPHRTSSALVVMLQQSFALTGFQKHISELRIHYFPKVPVEKKCMRPFPEVVLCQFFIIAPFSSASSDPKNCVSEWGSPYLGTLHFSSLPEKLGYKSPR